MERLFQKIDLHGSFFSEDEQNAMIRINAFLIMFYIRSPHFILGLINSRKVSKEKIKEYVGVVRFIRRKAEQIINKYGKPL